ncbi:MAG: hypothetical protein R3213_09160 [Flavobacteriaceae bacterium]|nr:hypothetical protein [Flavobacteriaceae bacterium]
MSFITKILGKKEKKPKAKCNLSNTLLEFGEGYQLTTTQLISSKKFWDHKMLEPETLSYTTAHFKNNDPSATKMREMIFNKYAMEEKSWLICESYIHLFDIDKGQAQEYAKEWWETGGQFSPPNSGPAQSTMDNAAYEEIREYATMEAGADRV